MKNEILASIGVAVVFMGGVAHADVPNRKPGLWELTVKEEGMPQPSTVKQCTDAATDKQMMDIGNSMGGSKRCARNEFHKTSTGYESIAECTIAGSTMKATGKYDGSFDSAYSGTVETTFTPPLFGRTGSKSVVSAKYLGACSGDMKPGDMVMNNGMKINIDTVAAQAKQAAAMMEDPKMLEAMKNASQAAAKGQGGISPEQAQAMRKAMEAVSKK